MDADLKYTPKIVKHNFAYERLYYIPKCIKDYDPYGIGEYIAVDVVRGKTGEDYMIDISYVNKDFFRLRPVENPFAEKDMWWRGPEPSVHDPLVRSRISAPVCIEDGIWQSTRTYYLEMPDVKLCKLLFSGGNRLNERDNKTGFFV